MGEKKGLSQTPLWALSEEEMAAAGWTGTQGEDLNGQPAERSSVLQEGFGVLPSVWDPMRDDMPDETASGGKEKPARRKKEEAEKMGVWLKVLPFPAFLFCIR